MIFLGKEIVGEIPLNLKLILLNKIWREKDEALGVFQTKDLVLQEEKGLSRCFQFSFLPIIQIKTPTFLWCKKI